MPDGLQEIGPWQLDQYFLEPFGDNDRRKALIDRFRAYLEELAKLGIPLELWLDGSFTTRKPDPDDVDIVIWASPKDVAGLPPDHKIMFRLLVMNRDRVQTLYDVDVYLGIPESPAEREQWRVTFGFSQTGKKLKGIFKLTLNHV